MAMKGQIVDCHAHILASDPSKYPYSPIDGHLPEWLPERAVDGDLLTARMNGAGVSKAVLVQFAHVHGYDNSYVVDVAAEHPERFVAVGVIEANDPNVSATMNRWADRGAAGFRLTGANRGAPPDWVMVPAVWETATQLELPLCIHFNVENRAEGIPRLHEMLSRFEKDVVVVLDHAGNPPFSQGPPSYGLETILDLERYPKLYLKFSTVNFRRMDEANVDLEPIMRRLIDRFGANRIMWGSDSPNSPGDYGDLLGRMQKTMASFSQIEEDWIMGETARTVYPKLRETSAKALGW